MIPYEIDPSLHDAAPAPEQLDDGFAPPAAPADPQPAARAHAEELLGEKSPF